MNPKQNLFKLARTNDPSLEKRFNTQISTFPRKKGDEIRRFAERVDSHSRLTVNMSPARLWKLLASLKGLPNIHQAALEEGRRTKTPRDQVIKKWAPNWFKKRIAFDTAFTYGREFKYMALNIGGMGAAKYGPWCAVADEEIWSRRTRLAYIPFDSLKGYVSVDGVVDMAALKADVASHEGKHHLAALKHKDDVPTLPEADWPSMLCNGEYVEAIFVGRLGAADLECVRLSRSMFQTYEDLLFESTFGPLDKKKQETFNELAKTLTALKDAGVRLEVVDDH